MDFIKYRVPPFPPSNKRGKGEIIEAHHKECSFSLPVEITSISVFVPNRKFEGTHLRTHMCTVCTIFVWQDRVIA